jgi:hypothetical protein
MRYAIIGVRAAKPSAWLGVSWRQRGLLLLAALMFHAVLLSLIRSNHFELPEPAASSSWNITARLMPPAPQIATSTPSGQPLVTPHEIIAIPKVSKPAAARRGSAVPAGAPMTLPSASANVSEGRADSRLETRGEQ